MRKRSSVWFCLFFCFFFFCWFLLVVLFVCLCQQCAHFVQRWEFGGIGCGRRQRPSPISIDEPRRLPVDCQRQQDETLHSRRRIAPPARKFVDEDRILRIFDEYLFVACKRRKENVGLIGIGKRQQGQRFLRAF